MPLAFLVELACIRCGMNFRKAFGLKPALPGARLCMSFVRLGRKYFDARKGAERRGVTGLTGKMMEQRTLWAFTRASLPKLLRFGRPRNANVATNSMAAATYFRKQAPET